MRPDIDPWPALSASWPAEKQSVCGPFIWQDGAGGGKRVSAALPQAHIEEQDLDAIEARFEQRNRNALFQLKSEDFSFDMLLSKRGYAKLDPTRCLTGPIERCIHSSPHDISTHWPAPHEQVSIWAGGGIGPSRLNVMERVILSKTVIAAEAGAAFVAASGKWTIVHALEVAPCARRRGLARALMSAAAAWGRTQGASQMALLVVEANVAARALYSSLGMQDVGGYHYRQKRET